MIGNQQDMFEQNQEYDQTNIMLRNLLDCEAEAIAKKAIEKAMNGDSTAIRTVLERIMPPRKETPINLKLPKITTLKSTVKAQAVVLKAATSGKITITEAKGVMSLIEDVRKGIIDDAEERLAAIDEKLEHMEKKK